MLANDKNKTIPGNLRIDPEKVESKIINFILETLEDTDKEGVAMGLSGGVDSSVVASLAAKAVEPEQVHTLYLPDRDSQEKYYERASQIANRLGIVFTEHDITEEVREKGAYRPLVMKISPFSSILNQFNIYISRALSRVVFHSDPYELTLKNKSFSSDFEEAIYRNSVGAIENSFNLRHRTRKQLIERYAEENNLLPIGAANRSEALVGWFVKDGIDDLTVEPLLGLYKSQVRELSYFLDLPEKVVEERPSPDMFKGLADEEIIGLPYERVDKCLIAIENDFSEGELDTESGEQNECKPVKEINELSDWKRENEHIYPKLN